MRFFRIFQVVAMILLISTLGVKFARAASQDLEMTLDSGFVGRTVSLDLFEGTARIGWDEGVLIKPTKLILSRIADGSIHIAIEDVNAFASGSVMHIALKSDITKSPALRVESNGVVTSLFAKKEKDLFSSDVVIARSMVVAAVSDPSVMPEIVNGVVPVTMTDESLVLTLDSGFVNRPVSLDVFGGAVTVAWDAKTLIKPTKITITSARGGVWQDQSSAANAVRIVFEDPTAISPLGVMSIKHKALRPPTDTERPDVNVFEVVTSTRKADFSGTSILYTYAAKSEVTFAPVYCSGIMRTGTASWYRYKGCLCAASPDVPKGTKLKVSRQDDPTKSVIITVNDYGPDRKIHPERVIDLDRVAFAAIGNPRGGVLNVTVEKVE